MNDWGGLEGPIYFVVENGFIAFLMFIVFAVVSVLIKQTHEWAEKKDLSENVTAAAVAAVLFVTALFFNTIYKQITCGPMGDCAQERSDTIDEF